MVILYFQPPSFIKSASSFFTCFPIKFSVLTLLSKADYLKAIDADMLQTRVMFYRHSYNNDNQIASIFWGLWLFHLGYLIFKSGLLPKVLGIFLLVGCFGNLIISQVIFFFQITAKPLFQTISLYRQAFGEIGTCLLLHQSSIICGTSFSIFFSLYFTLHLPYSI